MTARPFFLGGNRHDRVDTTNLPQWRGLTADEASRRAALRQAAQDDARASRISLLVWGLWAAIFIAAIVLSWAFPGPWFGHGWAPF